MIPSADGGGTDGVAADADPGNPIDIPGWTLAFHDEFEGTALDPSKRWVTYSGPQANAPDTSKFDPDNISVAGGQLHLKVEKRLVDGRPYACGGLEQPQDLSQTSGRWVVRAKFPPGYGYVGYIGLFGDGVGANYAEIDFAEVGGNHPSSNSFTQHYGDESVADTWSAADSTAGFHEYTVIWENDQFVWLVDGVQQTVMPQRIVTEPMLLAMGDWASSQATPWFGWPNATTPTVSSMDIDYVRVYRR
jgi:beta-glucanase (GH16 family)